MHYADRLAARLVKGGEEAVEIGWIASGKEETHRIFANELLESGLFRGGGGLFLRGEQFFRRRAFILFRRVPYHYLP